MTKSAKTTFILISILWFLLASYKKNWSRSQVDSDIVGYYSYLPAVFLDHDLTLSFIDKPGAKWKGIYWPTNTADGKHVIKYSMGLSLMYLPFFLIAHYIVAPLGDFEQDGYSDAYSACISIGCFFYLLLGLICLRKILIRFYPEKITLWVIVSVFFGTNLLWYSFGEQLMPHQFIFSLVSFMIYFTIKWYEQPDLKYSLALSVTCGFILLIRPVDGILCLFPLLYGNGGKNYFKEKINVIKHNWNYILLMFTMIFIVHVPQLIYWKTVTGHWFFYAYTGERFFLDNPHIMKGLFSYRKGWFVYTPLMLFAAAGLFFLKGDARKFIAANSIIIPLFIYVVFCWWIWWYGGSFGARPFVNMYALLAIPMGASFNYLLNNTSVKKLSVFIISILILVNIFQTYQYNNFIIHYDAMNKESYWSVFGKTERPEDWWRKLRLTDPVRTRKGLPEEYTQEELSKGGSYILRDIDNKLLVADTSGVITQIEKAGWDGSEKFEFIPLTENKFAIQGSNKKYIVINENNTWRPDADSKENAAIVEMKLINDNKVELSSSKGNYKAIFNLYMTE